jgi:plastocyanin
MRALRHMATTAVTLSGLALAGVSASFAADYVVVIDRMKFGSVPAALHTGDTITWQNDDIFRHSATARDGSFDFDLPAKTSAKMVLGEPGTIEFYCTLHPGMTGTLVISP